MRSLLGAALPSIPMRVLRIALAILAGFAQAASAYTIAVAPNCLTGVTPVALTVTWRSGEHGIVSNLPKVAIYGQVVKVVADAYCATIGVPPPGDSFTATLGTLSPGAYTLEYYTRPQLGCGTSTETLVASEPVLVRAGPMACSSRVEAVSGDRQIAVSTLHPREPFVVRAIDANGAPIVGARLFIGPAADPGFPYLQDEFGFRGFNTVGIVQYGGFGSPPPDYFAFADATGQAQGQGQFVDPAPASFIVAAGRIDQGGTRPAMLSVVAVRTEPPGNPSVVVEYFHDELHHYFNTITDVEIAALDAGVFAGWRRSVGAFIAYRSNADSPLGAVPVCRFFSSQYTSHFYTADPDECALVATKWPNVWTLETKAAFYINVPDKQTGQCPNGQQPVYRLFNNKPSPNHRYVTDAKLRDRMIGAGWIAEGYGPEAVMLCTPA